MKPSANMSTSAKALMFQACLKILSLKNDITKAILKNKLLSRNTDYSMGLSGRTPD